MVPSRYDGSVQVHARREQQVSWLRQHLHPSAALRGVALVLVLSLAAKAAVDLVRHDHWLRDTSERTLTFHPKALPAVERRLRGQGVRVSTSVHELLAVVLTAWESRQDLRTLFSESNGAPDLPGLLGWAESLPDGFSTAIVPHFGAIAELRGRMSLLPADGNVLPVLYWTLQNRARPFSSLGPVIGRLANLWRQRPELQDRFATDGRVDVLALLQWANALPPSDPAFFDFFGQYFEIRQAILQLAPKSDA